MARVKFSAVVNSVQGSVGGSVFQRNRSGYTLKNKSINVDKQSVKQSASRRYMTELQNQWRAFTDVQRNAYDLFANYYPLKNRNNQNVNLTGYQLYLKYNLFRLHAGYNILTTITYGIIEKLSTEVNIFRNVNDIVVTPDVSFDDSVHGAILMLSAPRLSGYPIKANCYRAIPLLVPYYTSYIITDEYIDLYGMVPYVGVYLSYKFNIFSKTMPVVQEGDYMSILFDYP